MSILIDLWIPVFIVSFSLGALTQGLVLEYKRKDFDEISAACFSLGGALGIMSKTGIPEPSILAIWLVLATVSGYFGGLFIKYMVQE